jgi:arsenate reductase
MAEAILRHETDGLVEVGSAGLRVAGEIDPMAIQVLEEVGIDTSELRPKSVDEFRRAKRIDCAIIVCERAEENCPSLYPFCYRVLRWPCKDPVPFNGPEYQRLDRFRQLRDELQEQIRSWLEERPFGDSIAP